MKSLIILGAIAGFAAASSTQISRVTGERLNSTLTSLKDRSLKKKLAISQQLCPKFSFDIHFLADGTAEGGEFAKYWNYAMEDFVRYMVTWLLGVYPDSRIAFSNFRDKPFEPVGAPNDTCFSMATDFTDSVADLIAVTRRRSFTGGSAPGGGDEMYNAQSQAILSAVQYSGVSWRESVLARPYGDPARTNVIKQVILISYTKPHGPRDGLSTVPKLPSMIDNTYIASGNPDELCRQQDYPDILDAITNSVNNNYINFGAFVPYHNQNPTDNNTNDVYDYWDSIATNVDPSNKGYFKLRKLFRYGEEDALKDLTALIYDSEGRTCAELIRTGNVPSPEPEPSTYTWTDSGHRTDQPPTTSTPPPVSTVLPSGTTRTETTLGDRTDQPATTTTGTTTGTTSATTPASSTSSTSTSTAVNNGTGHGCCDGIEFKAEGRIEEVSMQFKWAQRVKRLLSAVAW